MVAEGSEKIPYDDHPLTKAMKDSIGGNAITIMIVNISPSIYDKQETKDALTFAKTTGTIRNLTLQKETVISITKFFHLLPLALFKDKDLTEFKTIQTFVHPHTIQLSGIMGRFGCNNRAVYCFSKNDPNYRGIARWDCRSCDYDLCHRDLIALKFVEDLIAKKESEIRTLLQHFPKKLLEKISLTAQAVKVYSYDSPLIKFLPEMQKGSTWLCNSPLTPRICQNGDKTTGLTYYAHNTEKSKYILCSECVKAALFIQMLPKSLD